MASGHMDEPDETKTRLTPGGMALSVDRTEKIKMRESGDTKECYPCGLCPLPDGGWLVTDHENKVLKRLDGSNNIVDRCPMSGDLLDVCFIEDYNMAAVTGGDENDIKLISLEGDMAQVRTIQTDHYCYAVTYANEKLYVTPAQPAGTEIYEHDYSDGRLVRTISPRDSQGENRFSFTGYITSNKDGSRLFMVDGYSGLFIIDTQTADVIQQVDVDIQPGGVCIGEDCALFVATSDDGIIHLDHNGTKLGTVVTREMMEGLKPWCVSYDKKTARLAVTVGYGGDYMFVFHIK